jgi:hypothetical protein
MADEDLDEKGVNCSVLLSSSPLINIFISAQRGYELEQLITAIVAARKYEL